LGHEARLTGALQGASLAAPRLRHGDRQRRDLVTYAWLASAELLCSWRFLAGNQVREEKSGLRGSSTAAAASPSASEPMSRHECNRSKREAFLADCTVVGNAMLQQAYLHLGSWLASRSAGAGVTLTGTGHTGSGSQH
jgi:hypothetical protein